MHRAATVPLMFACMGCSEEPTVEVRVCSFALVPRAIPAGGWSAGGAGRGGKPTGGPQDGEFRIDVVRLRFLDQHLEEVDSAIKELSRLDGDVEGIDFRSDLEVPGGASWIGAQGLLGGVVVQSFERHVGSFDDINSLQMPFTESCYRIECAAGQTCVDGNCVIAPDATGSPVCP